MRKFLPLLLLHGYLVDAVEYGLVAHETRKSTQASELAASRSRVEAEAILPMRIALKPNKHAPSKAEAWLMEVSDPVSEDFGRHWSQDQVVAAFRPAAESVHAVTAWLNGLGVTDVTHTDNKQWLAFDIPASKAEAVFHTEYFEHEMKGKDGQVQGFEASCDEYYLPTHLTEHIDFVKPGIQGIDVTGRTSRSRKYMEISGVDHALRGE